jgi:hypothetical protein
MSFIPVHVAQMHYLLFHLQVLGSKGFLEFTSTSRFCTFDLTRIDAAHLSYILSDVYLVSACTQLYLVEIKSLSVDRSRDQDKRE